jgi:hypothetical protein
LLGYESSEPAELRAGLEHCELVLEHGADAERLEALRLLISGAGELDDRELVLRWCERTFAELDAQPDASDEHRAGARISAGIGLAIIGDPRGEPLLELVARELDELPLHLVWDLERSWIGWLADTGRCAEAEQRRMALIARMAAHSFDSLPTDYPDWRDASPDSCTSNP